MGHFPKRQGCEPRGKGALPLALWREDSCCSSSGRGGRGTRGSGHCSCSGGEGLFQGSHTHTRGALSACQGGQRHRTQALRGSQWSGDRQQGMARSTIRHCVQGHTDARSGGPLREQPSIPVKRGFQRGRTLGELGEVSRVLPQSNWSKQGMDSSSQVFLWRCKFWGVLGKKSGAV